MIKSLKAFIQQQLTPEGDTRDREHTLELCAAVLMLEIALADSDVDKQELSVIEDAIRLHFHLDADEAGMIIKTAEQEVDHAVSLHDFTRVINDSLSRAEKVIVIELLWKVACADMVIDKYEEYFIRKISDLLYVSHSDYIRAKHKALE